MQVAESPPSAGGIADEFSCRKPKSTFDRLATMASGGCKNGPLHSAKHGRPTLLGVPILIKCSTG